MFAIRRPHLSFVPPRLLPEEWEPPTEAEREEEWLAETGLHSGIGEAHLRPMVWTRDPPTVPGWYWCRYQGAQDVIRVEAGFEYQPDSRVEWSSCALPVPGPVERRR